MKWRLSTDCLNRGLPPASSDFENANPEATPPHIIYPYVDGGDLSGLIREWYSSEIKSLPVEKQRDLAMRAHSVIFRLAKIMAPVHRLGIVLP